MNKIRTDQLGILCINAITILFVIAARLLSSESDGFGVLCAQYRVLLWVGSLLTAAFGLKSWIALKKQNEKTEESVYGKLRGAVILEIVLGAVCFLFWFVPALLEAAGTMTAEKEYAFFAGGFLLPVIGGLACIIISAAALKTLPGKQRDN